VLRLVGLALAVFGLVAALGLLAHARGAYELVATADAAARLSTPNAFALFEDVAHNGVVVNSAIDARSRAAYSDAMNQFLLDGTGLLIAMVFRVGGIFLRLSH
jgi:hypothetical protein